MKKLCLLLVLLFLLSPLLSLDARGRSLETKRSPAVRAQFMKQNPCPATGRTSGACSGYVVDHIVPLRRGGTDHPDNMQWQTKEAAKEKDRWE